MDFYTNCFIPTLEKEIKVKHIKFGDYIKLNNYIKNSDFEHINQTFNEICEYSINGKYKLKNLDKFYLLLHLKNFFFDVSLKLSGKNEEEKVIFDILLQDIMKNCRKYNFNNFQIPENLYYKNVEDILKETSKNIEEIKNHVQKNKILMFETPEIIKGIPKIYINCFDNSLFYFCKLLYSTNLNNLYLKIVNLKKNLNFFLDEIYEMNPKELDLFLKTK